MFFNLSKAEKRAALIGIFLVLAFAFGLAVYYLTGRQLKKETVLIAVATSGVVTAVLALIPNTNLDEIKSRDAGDGQHGSARWINAQELRNQYAIVKRGQEITPGIVVGQTAKLEWIVDTSDKSALILAPPGAGKTKTLIFSSLYYNLMVALHTKGRNAPSYIITDLKGEIISSCGTAFQRSGYAVRFLNLRDPFNTYFFNLMNNVNINVDKYLKADAEDARLIAYGRAERYAKILAESIVHNIHTDSTSDASAYFNDTAQGLLTGIILLVSEYAARREQRHILSVFNLIIELNSCGEQAQTDKTDAQRNKLRDLMEFIPNARIKQHVGSAIAADFRTSMNIFSSALGKLVGLIDAELEQMLASHSPELSDIDFIRQPTALFIICPDENPTRFLFGSLFMRYFLNDLIAQARESDTGRLDRQVFVLFEEFGNSPPVKDIDVLFSAVRSIGVRIIPTLQSLAQLEKNYSRTTAKIIRETCQITIATYVAPMARETAEELSRTLGNRTVQAGSVSHSKENASETIQMTGRPLMTADEIMAMPIGQYLILKSGCRPMKAHIACFESEFALLPPYKLQHHIEASPIDRMTEADLRGFSKPVLQLHRGMFG